MALSGTVNSGGFEGRYLQLTWSASQNISNNTSTINWSLKAAGNATHTWYYARKFKVVIDGEQVFYHGGDIVLYNGTSIGSGSKTITHNNDGTRSFSIYIEGAIYYSSINATGSSSFTLNQIPRTSQISITGGNDEYGSFAGVLPGDYTNDSNQVIVHTNRHSSSFKHNLDFEIGSSGHRQIVSDISITDTYTWTLPSNILNYITDGTSKTGTLFLYTYSGSTCIGSSTCAFNVYVPDKIKPTVDSLSVSLDNSANSVIDGWGLAVAGYTKAKVTATASGTYASTIKSFTISGGYNVTISGSSLGYTGDVLSSGDKTFTVSTKDSRGKVSPSKSATLTVYGYTPPSITSFSVNRNVADDTNVTCNATWSFASVNGKNSSTGTVQYKKNSDTSWTTYGTITSGTDTTITGIDDTSGYEFRLIVVDSVGNSTESDTRIGTKDVLLNFRHNGKGLGIGKIAEDDQMEVGMNARFFGSISQDVTGVSKRILNVDDLVPLTPVVLYYNASGTVGDIDLTTSASGYSYVEILFCQKASMQFYNSVKVPYPAGRQFIALVSTNVYSQTFRHDCTCVSFTSDTHIHVERYLRTEFWGSDDNGTTFGSYYDQNYIAIIAVIGYK